MSVYGVFVPRDVDPTTPGFAEVAKPIVDEIERQGLRKKTRKGDFVFFDKRGKKDLGTIVHEFAHRGIQEGNIKIPRSAVRDKNGLSRRLNEEDFMRLIEVIATSFDEKIWDQAERHFAKKNMDLDTIIHSESALGGVMKIHKEAQRQITVALEEGTPEEAFPINRFFQNFPDDETLDKMIRSRGVSFGVQGEPPIKRKESFEGGAGAALAAAAATSAGAEVEGEASTEEKTSTNIIADFGRSILGIAETGLSIRDQLVDIGRGVLIGGSEAGEQLLRTVGLEEFSDWLHQQPGGNIDVGKPETLAGELAAPITQAGVIMAPGARAVKALGVASSFVQWTLGGALADFAAFSPDEPGIANLTSALGDLPQPQLEKVRRTIEDYFKKNQQDSTLVKRLKNAAEGAIVGATFDGLVQLAKAGKKTLLVLASGAAVSALSSDKAEAGPAKEIIEQLIKRGIKPPEPFFSKALKVIVGATTKAASGEQWLATFKNAGITQDEMVWLGLHSFLAGGRQVTRDELEEYMRVNQVKLRETINSDTPTPEFLTFKQNTLDGMAEEEFGVRFTDLSVGDQQRLEDDFERLVIRREVRDENESDFVTALGDVEDELHLPIYGEYTLPGGENYKEWLLQLPKIDPKDQEAAARRLYGKSLSELTKAERERIKIASSSMVNYYDPHFDAENLVAHTRTTERVAPSGQRVFFVEEIQSDWMQSGRKHGFSSTLGSKFGAEDLQASPTGYGDDLYWTIGPKGTNKRIVTLSRSEARTPEEAIEVARTWLIGVPHAPFKRTWHELAFRRMVRQAVEGDFDRIAWTTGRQQAERYNLGQVVDTIDYSKVGDNWMVFGYRGGPTGERVIQHGVSDRDLDGFVGRQVADMMRDGKGTKAGSLLKLGEDRRAVESSEVQRRLTNLDVQLSDDEGMNTFYDKILVNYANKFGKRFGAKTEDIHVMTIRDPENKKYRAEGAPDKVTVHSLPITDKMRETALREGFPLF